MSSQPAAPPQPHTPSTFHTGSLYSPHPRAFLDLPHSRSTHFQAKSPEFSPTPRETIWCLSTRSRTSSPCAQISTYQAHFCNFSRQDWIYIGPSLPFDWLWERKGTLLSTFVYSGSKARAGQALAEAGPTRK